jgi:DNA-binding NtrC family response regulator
MTTHSIDQAQRRKTSYDGAVLAGTSPAARSLQQAARAVGRSEVHVLLSGEPGTGKREWAEVIHRWSGCGGAPFLVVPSDRPGGERLERMLRGDGAPGEGTLYLERVDTLPLSVQERLAEWLAGPVASRMRLVAGVAAPVGEQVRLGRLSPALYRLLGTVQLHVPPLRERPEDIAAIAERFHARWAARTGAPPRVLEGGVVATLGEYAWPGNARELLGALEAAAARGLPITREAVRAVMGTRARRSPAGDVVPLWQLERDYILGVLARCGGNRSLAARRLGIGRGTLLRALKACLQRSSEAA